MSIKNPLTLAGIELATFRFVAQHLNHCATAVPIHTHTHTLRKPHDKGRFVPVHDIVTCGGKRGIAHSFLTSTLDGYEWPASRLLPLYPSSVK